MTTYINKSVVISVAWPYTKNPPYTATVMKSVRTVLSLIYLNKLWIPDVLIDIIKDYLYISKDEILRNYYKNSINASFKRLLVDHHYLVDLFGRRRQVHAQWKMAGIRSVGEVGIQFQQYLCITCGERSGYHTRFDGCCEMEFDGEDGTLELSDDVVDVVEDVVVVEEEEEEEDYSFPYEYENEEFDGYDSDEWYAGDRYKA